MMVGCVNVQDQPSDDRKGGESNGGGGGMGDGEVINSGGGKGGWGGGGAQGEGCVWITWYCCTLYGGGRGRVENR